MTVTSGAPVQRPLDEPRAVSSGLNLWLPLKDPAQMRDLLLALNEQKSAINAALTGLHYVHFARFVPTPDSAALQVITSFDGEFDAYVLDFVLAIGDQFDMILHHVKDAPPLPVKDFPAQFLQFVADHNLGYGQSGGGGVGLYSAYPDRTVIDIVGASGIGPAAIEPTAVVVNRGDVQANVLRGITTRHAWHVGLRVAAVAGARSLLHELLTGSEGAPRLSNDAPWPDARSRPAYVLNLGFTYAGLLRLGIEAADEVAFEFEHRAFVRGPDQRDTAANVGDVGASQPAYWRWGGGYAMDMVVSLYADDEQTLAHQCDALLSRCRVHGLSIVNRPWSAQGLTDDKHPGRHVVHFGFADGLGQPRLAIVGDPMGEPDMQPRAGVGEFVLGADYPNVFGGKHSLGGLSAPLAQNATFAALRFMEQDVVAFEALLDEASAAHNVDREWLAAKLMGRWRDGTPLSNAPDRLDDATGAVARNAFDYLPSVDHPGTYDDSAGLRCPIGAHARRMNPRSARVAGRPHSRRMLRRGMPYGPKFVPGAANDGVARGLVGLFMCADLERQFEFTLRQWSQGDKATAGIAGQQDPIIGSQTLHDDGHEHGLFRIARPAGCGAEIVLQVPRLVKTVGSVYLFMPGMSGVKYLADLRGNDRVLHGASLRPFPEQLRQWLRAPFALNGASAATAPDPATFDPRDKAFRDDPFTTYAWFRKAHPVVELPQLHSTWVFSHEHVGLIAGDPQRFRKRKSDNTSPAGLLNMDAPPHTACRATIEPLFNAVLADVAPSIVHTVSQHFDDRCKGRGQVDLMVAFAQPVARAVFFDVFGLTVTQASSVIKQAEGILALVSPADDPRAQKEIAKRLRQLSATLYINLQGLRQPGRMFDRILNITTVFDPVSNTPYPPPPAKPVATALQVEHMANAAILTLAGFLPLQWFIALATWRLLDHNGALLKQLKADPTISNRDVVDELLRFDMTAPLSDRYVAHDNTVIGGVTFAKDQRLTLAWSSANHDERAFGPDADTINLTRRKGAGFAFGAAGDRACLGNQMVYLVMEPIIQLLRDATPVPRLVDGFVPTWGTWSEGAMFRPMTSLMAHC